MKAVAAMRNQFGGHALRTAPPAGGDVAKSDQEAPPAQAPEAEASGAGGSPTPSES
jgi:6-phosphogluconate dehydrogenase